jgi:hypothetical protein
LGFAYLIGAYPCILTSKYYSIKTFSVHLLLWAGYVLSEYLANLVHLQTGSHILFLRSTLLSLPVLMMPTYFIALVAVPRFLQWDRMHYFAVSVAGVAIFIFLARIKWMELIHYLEMERYYRVPASKVVKNVIRDYAIVALAVCIHIIGDWKRKQRLNEQLIKTKAEAEIKLLKGQLHPHFLFNSLNNIYSLALMKSDLTADSILKLTELLDYLIYEAGREKVSLAKEVQLLDNYIELEKLRYEDKLEIFVNRDVANDAVNVTPLILLPFAENCFKHGGPGKDGRFQIQIDLKVDQRRLVFQIQNTKKATGPDRKISGGIGLQNIRERLQLVYPNRHRLEIRDGAECYEVRLEIGLQDQ